MTPYKRRPFAENYSPLACADQHETRNDSRQKRKENKISNAKRTNETELFARKETDKPLWRIVVLNGRQTMTFDLKSRSKQRRRAPLPVQGLETLYKDIVHRQGGVQKFFQETDSGRKI